MVDGEVLPANSDWTRLEVTYTATSAKTLTPHVLTYGSGSVYIDCVQVEKAPTASRYNLIENGDFRYSLNGWTYQNFVSADGIYTHTAAAPELEETVVGITGDPLKAKYLTQTVNVSGGEGDTFVLAGWAKGDSIPIKDSRQFAIIGTFHYTDGGTGEFKAQFNPDTDSDAHWQYSSAAMVAEKAYSSITVTVAYDYNVNTVYFDGIQLFKEEFGSSYTYENGDVKTVTDIQGGTTEYTYNTTHDVTSIKLPDETVTTYTYDNYHNVKTATTHTGVVYTFEYDQYGNNTSVTIGSGTAVIRSEAEYDETNGNRLISTTDAVGNTTTYNYNADTNVLEWVKYPKDTDATKTSYTYDDMYRMATATATTDTNTALTASYTYTDDLLTEIETHSTTYSFNYGNFALRSNVKIGSRTLASYSYTDRTNYLASLDYGNGDKVQYGYDKQGRVVSQTYEDGDTVTYRYDNSGALATVTDSATGRTTTYYYDFTDRLMKYVESGSGYSHSVGYAYDDLNNLTALVETINGTERTTSYAYDDDNRISSITDSGADKNSTDDDITESYTYDSYGRIHTRVTSCGGTAILTETYTYKTNASGQPTSQVETLTSSSISGQSVTYTYEYDSNGNITSVKESDGNTEKTTTYVYDSANQLIRENNQKAEKTWTYSYDAAGNIRSKTEYAFTTGTLGTALDTIPYTYGDSTWGDLLTAHDGNAISYDNIGNPENDGTWTYTWEHGRQLAIMSSENIGGGNNDVTVSYTYDANGMRTGKTVTKNTYHTHSYAEAVTEPTCTTDGYTTYTCACGDTYTGNETSATGHSYAETVVAPTCTEDGYTTYTCSACSNQYTDAQTEALGHSYETSTDANGNTVYTCSRCGDSYIECSEQGHDYVIVEVVAATCTTGGYTVGECTLCGESAIIGRTFALGHNYTNGVYQSLYCIRCGEPKPGGLTPILPGINQEDSASVISGNDNAAEPASTDATSAQTLVSTATSTYRYVYNGSSLSQMTVVTETTENGETTTTTEILDFTYDVSGTPLAVTYNDTTYYYSTNLQGDVVAILDGSGNAVVSYTYNAWGEILTIEGSLASTLGAVNPLTYRGYVYDTETELYYLQSRYYDPAIGRLINADAFTSTGQGLIGNNMFAYCANNPVNHIDPTGTKHIWFQLFEDHQFGFIHNAVQQHILLRANVESIVLGKEAVIPGGGRADIIDLGTREVWEIKHGGSSIDMQLERADAAWDQLERYLKADKSLVPGRANRFVGAFVLNDIETSYVVIYWTPDPGVILYSVHELPEYNPYPFKAYVPAFKANEQKHVGAYLVFAFVPIMEPLVEKAYGY